MVSKKYIKNLGFEDIDGLYNYILESKINGNYEQTRQLVKKLTRLQFMEFIESFLYSLENEYIYFFKLRLS